VETALDDETQQVSQCFSCFLTERKDTNVLTTVVTHKLSVELIKLARVAQSA
jgi:hypothetical protein